MQFRSVWRYRDDIPKSERIWGWPALLILAWLTILFSMPLIERAWGERAFSYSLILSVLFQAGVVLFLMIRGTGIFRAAFTATGVIILTWAIEAIGTSTSFPFGSYNYTERLQPQILGVPLLIPFAWLMMMPPSWAIAQRLGRSKGRLIFIILGALAFTAWDLFLDPQMVKWDLWIWISPSGYFGIPWSNFAGWLISAFLITVLLRPVSLPERPMILLYSLTWGMETAGLILFWDLKGPALFGFIGMGVFIIPSIYLGRKRKL